MRCLGLLAFVSSLAGCVHDPCLIYQNNPAELAIHQLKDLAEDGDRDAQFLLGRMFELGEGVDQDIPQGIAWYQKAVKQQHTCAMNNIAVRYKTGDHIYKDHGLAFALSQQAARSMHPVTLTSLGEMYEYGQGTPVDKDRALDLYQQALGQGYAGAFFLIGRLSIERAKTPEEKEQGLVWLFVYELWQKDNATKLRSKGSATAQEFARFINKTRAETSLALARLADSQAIDWYLANKHRLLTRKQLIQQCCQH